MGLREETTMTTYRGNETVQPGFYINVRGLSFEAIEQPKALPGNSSAIYRRVPVAAMLAAAPLIGLAFLVFLPFIGIAMVASLVAGKAADVAADTVRAGARVVRPNWEPSLAFLSRSKRAKDTPKAPVVDTWAEEAGKKLGRPNGDASESQK
jgi:hypothetical protein